MHCTFPGRTAFKGPDSLSRTGLRSARRASLGQPGDDPTAWGTLGSPDSECSEARPNPGRHSDGFGNVQLLAVLAGPRLPDRPSSRPGQARSLGGTTLELCAPLRGFLVSTALEAGRPGTSRPGRTEPERTPGGAASLRPGPFSRDGAGGTNSVHVAPRSALSALSGSRELTLSLELHSFCCLLITISRALRPAPTANCLISRGRGQRKTFPGLSSRR